MAQGGDRGAVAARGCQALKSACGKARRPRAVHELFASLAENMAKLAESSAATLTAQATLRLKPQISD